jgi:hypothetical protein
MRILYTETADAHWIKPSDPLPTPEIRFTAHERALLKQRFWKRGLTNDQGFRVRRWRRRFDRRETPPKIPYAVQTMEKGGLVWLERVNKRLQSDDNGKFLQARFTPEGINRLPAPEIGLWRSVRQWVRDAWHRGSALLRRRSANSARSTANPR